MKKALLIIGLFLSTLSINAQNCILTEDFETVDSCVAYGGQILDWTQYTGLSTSGGNSMFGGIFGLPGDTLNLATISFDCTGLTFIKLRWSQIAKLEFFDAGILEYSIDGGASWDSINKDNSIYNGASTSQTVWNVYGKFVAANYPVWQPSVQGAQPDNTWWINEELDVSQILANQPNCQIRFRVFDGNGNGSFSNFGWLIDDVCVLAAPCELDGPAVFQNSPVWQNTVYNLGPYNVSVDASDPSGVQSVTLFYSINSSPYTSVPLTNTIGTTWTGQIPVVNDSDNVCYYFEAVDSSCNNNLSQYPITGQPICFIATTGISFPFCDDFELTPSLWTASNLSGDNWITGTPTNGGYTPHSGNNVWAVGLNAQYQNSTECYLTSPVFDFSNAANATVSFWFNMQTEQAFDGTRLDFTTDGTTWGTLGQWQDPDGTNWYNMQNIISSNKPAWAGFSNDAFNWPTNQNGWVQASIRACQLNYQTGPVQFRFVFTSDGSVQDPYFAIDDFCITLAPPVDVGVTSIVSPQLETGCNSSSPVTVWVKNYGSQTINAFPVTYSINGVVDTTYNWTGSLVPCDSVQITIDTLVVPCGGYDLCAWTGAVGDADFSNDTSCASLVGLPIIALDYCDDFESGNIGWVSIPDPTTGDKWELGFPNYGATTGAHSGTNAWDINLDTTYGFGVTGADLKSPIFDFSAVTTAGAYLSFWQNRSLPTNDGFTIDYTTNGITWQTLGIFNDPDGTNWYNTASIAFNGTPAWDASSNGWIKCTHYLDASFAGLPFVRFRFHFTSWFNGPLDGVSIDDFCIKLPQPIDAGVASINVPSGTTPLVEGQTQAVQVTIKNYGSTTLTTIPVSYSINGALYGPETWTGTLSPNSSVAYPFDTAFVVPSCGFEMKSFTSEVGDGDFTNDTAYLNLSGLPTFSLPYCDNFDTSNVCWAAVNAATASSSIWQLGTPNFGLTNSAHSSPNSWDIDLNSGYNNSAETYLYSPNFIFTNDTNATMSFWINHNTEQAFDGVRMDYSLNSGASWNVLNQDSFPVNWYNQANLISSNDSAWAGNSNGWIRCEYNLSQFNGVPGVQFRFAFTSDAFVTVDGFSMDDFCITLPYPHDVGVEKVIYPVKYAGIGTSANPTVKIKNFGANTESSFDIDYSINGGTPTVFAWTGILPPNGRLDVTLPAPFTVPSGTYAFCAWTDLVGDGNRNNDTSCTSPTGVPVIVPNFADAFDTSNTWIPDNFGTNLWQLGTPNFGTTNTAHSPPNSWDINLNTGYFADADTSFLYSPFFDLTGKEFPQVHFWQNRAMAQFGFQEGLNLQYSLGDVDDWKPLGNTGLVLPYAFNWYNDQIGFNPLIPVWDLSSAGWVQSAIDSISFLGNKPLVQFRFAFITDFFDQGDGVSVDDFELNIPISLNASPTAVYRVPQNNPIIFPGIVDFGCTVKNKGYLKLDSVNVSLFIDGSLAGIDAGVQLTPPLQITQSRKHNFTFNQVLSPGLHTLCCVTSYPNGLQDLFIPDDTTCTDIIVFDSITPPLTPGVCYDFESGPQWATFNALSYSANQSWKKGTPSKINLNSAHSGTNAWVTNLTGNYPNRDTSGLYTPVFNVDPTKCYKISFWHRIKTPIGFEDGGTLEYTTDAGVTWGQIGYYGTGWMNAISITGLGFKVPPSSGWSGDNGAWQHMEHEVQFPFGTQVIFRFRFGSDYSINDEGWAIDDVCLEELPTPCVVGVDDPNANNFAVSENYPDPANDQTAFEYNIPENGFVKVDVQDMIGQVIQTPVAEDASAGKHIVTLNTASLAPGIYFYSITYNNERVVKKMVVSR